MSVHPDGTGTGWTNVEAVDVDQPHGKDYLYIYHVAKGVRKRMNQEHSAFADATVGGIHKPGGCAVLGMEITDDCTAPLVDDGTYRGHGLIWSYSKDASNFGILFCTTGAAGASTTGTDWTVLKMHPDLQWSSGDVTWAGAHQFDSSVDFSKAAFDASVDFSKAAFDASVDFSKAAFDATIDATHAFFDGTVIASGLEVTGAAVHDGTSDFYDEADFSDVAVSGSFCVGTISVDTSGSVTLPGGIILKWGQHTHGGNDITDHTFPVAFPTACWQVTVAGGASVSAAYTIQPYVYDVCVGGFGVILKNTQSPTHYMAVGN